MEDSVMTDESAQNILRGSIALSIETLEICKKANQELE